MLLPPEKLEVYTEVEFPQIASAFFSLVLEISRVVTVVPEESLVVHSHLYAFLQEAKPITINTAETRVIFFMLEEDQK